MYERELIRRSTHLFGAVASTLILALLVVDATRFGTVWHIVSFSIFGTCLVLLYSASTLYHLHPLSEPTKKVLQRIDHSMIYVLIAGTYTPILLVPLRGAWGWSLFGALWGLAVLGILWKSVSVHIISWQSRPSTLQWAGHSVSH